MIKIKQAQKILEELGLPIAQQNEISAFTLIALCGIRKRDSWEKASRKSHTITKGIMAFIKENYRKTYAPNTRETFRRQVLHQFVQSSIAEYNPDNPNLPTNSPNAHYCISKAALNAIRLYGTEKWKKACENFKKEQGSLFEIYRKKRKSKMIPVRMPKGKTCRLGKVYVSAFPDLSEFRKHLKAIAWETEVWIAEIPDHLIHYNGDKFFGPH